MPNEVYRSAVDGLSDLVPPRVAKRLVDEALRTTRRTPDDVSLSAMRRLLLGPIRSELEGVLPPGAAGPGLKRVAAGLAPRDEGPRRRWWPLGRRAPAREDAGGRAAAAGEAPAPAPGGPDAAAASPAPALGAAAGPSAPPRGAEAAPPAEPASGDRQGEARPTEAAPRVAPPLPALDDALVDRALRAFGSLETVRQVVAVRGQEVVVGSGDGVDESALPGLALATSRLLGRDGTLRMFSLERPSGALFLFPLLDGALVVLTKPKVNVGAVLAARAALEEAA